jgi:hypothetical protein
VLRRAQSLTYVGKAYRTFIEIPLIRQILESADSWEEMREKELGGSTKAL